MCFRKVIRLISSMSGSFSLQNFLFNLTNDDAKTERKMWIFGFLWDPLLSSSQDNALPYMHHSWPFLSWNFEAGLEADRGKPWLQRNKCSYCCTSCCRANCEARPSARAQLPLQKAPSPPRLPRCLLCPRVSGVALALLPALPSPATFITSALLSSASSLCSAQDISVCFSQPLPKFTVPKTAGERKETKSLLKFRPAINHLTSWPEIICFNTKNTFAIAKNMPSRKEKNLNP